MHRRAAVAVVLTVLAACSQQAPEPGTAEPTPCTTPSPAAELAKLPENIPFEEWGTVTYLKSKQGFAVVRFVSDTTVVELHPKIARAVIDAGYEIVGADNEGFESEIFFQPRGTRTGYFQLREGPCEGQVTTSMIFGERA